MRMALIGALLLVSIVVIGSILSQPAKSDGFNSLLTGNQETFFSKNKGRTKEALKVRLTAVSAFLFAAIVIALGIVK